MLLRRLVPISGTSRTDIDGEDVGRDEAHFEVQEEPDLIAAIVLLGQTFGRTPRLFECLTSDATVAILEVAHADWVQPVAEAIRACFAGDGKLLGRGRRRKNSGGPPEAIPPGPIVITDDGSFQTRSGTEYSDGKVAKAFREYRALIGVTARSGRGLPEDLVLASEARIVLTGLDPISLGLVVELVAGTVSDRSIPADIAAAARPRDLKIALHRARGADGSVGRLITVVGNRLRAVATTGGPKLEDLAGYGAVREWGLTTAADLAAYAEGRLEESEIEPGILLAGPPGTGKTMFAAAIARQAGVPLISGSLGQWQSAGEAHLGTTLRAMRSFFRAARETSPCIALIDELDSFGDRQRFSDHNSHYASQVVNGLLECLDGAEGRKGVVLVGTTNAPQRIDPAILRSGRFDRCMIVPLPGLTDLVAILRHHLGRDLAGVDLTRAARRALGGSGADCAAWVRRARGRARRAARPTTLADLLLEIGSSGNIRSSEQDRRVAVHECGHAVVANAFGIRLGVVSLDTVDGGAGTEFHVGLDHATGTMLRETLAVHLAGRAAEIVVLGEASTGSASDLAEATVLCRNMHARWGLGRRIAVQEAAELPYDVLLAVEQDLLRAFDLAVSIIVERRASLDRLAEVLLARRSLEGREATAVMGSPPSD
jgi:DNA polymerase III delta prime subunit